MIAENEMVLYGSHGVCRVAGTVTREFDGKEALYYVLEPVFTGAFTVFVPVDSPAVSAKMRRILTSDEIHEMIRKMPEDQDSPPASEDPPGAAQKALRSGRPLHEGSGAAALRRICLCPEPFPGRGPALYFKGAGKIKTQTPPAAKTFRR